MRRNYNNFFRMALLIWVGLLILVVFSNNVAMADDGLVPCTNDCTLCHVVIGFQGIFEFFWKNVLLPMFLLAVTLAGVAYLVSSGSSKLMSFAKQALGYSLAGLVFFLCSWLIVNFIMLTLGYKAAEDSWYKFECDTTQTEAPVSTPGTSSTPETPSTPATDNGTGCAAVVKNIKSMEGWTYTQEKPQRTQDGSGDCSSTTERAFTRAGCKSPGGSTSAMSANGKSFTDASSLKAGDALVWNNGKTGKDSKGHVGICLNDGCTQIMAASTKTGIRASSGGSSSISAQAAKNGSTLKVLKASDYCPASSC